MEDHYFYIESEQSDELIELLSEKDIFIAGHDLISDYYALFCMGMKKFNTKHDTAVAQYLLDSSRSGYSLKVLGQEYLRTELLESQDLVQSGYSWCSIVDQVRMLQNRRIQSEEMDQVFREIELPLIEPMESLKVDLFENQVFVFTPRGDVLELPAGSTPLDFAFKIHSGIGEKCVGAKVNGKMVPIDHQLENGTIVEIVTSPNSRGPSIDWLKIAKSSTARNKIRQFLRRDNKSGDIEKGKDAIDKYVRKKGYDPRILLRNMYIIRFVKENKLSGTDELYSQIANGGSYVSKVATALLKYYNEDKKEDIKKESNDVEVLIEEKAKTEKAAPRDKAGVKVKGVDNLMIRVSRCCNPVPGDEIIGFITKGRGISVHRKDCTNITSLPEEEKQRFIDVEWDTTEEKSYNADITVVAQDRKGLFSDISKVCENMDVHISGVNAKSSKEKTIHIILTLSISNTAQMKKILRTLHDQFRTV